MPECELVSKTYHQLQVTPAGALTVGDMNKWQDSHGFNITAFTAAMLALAEDATMIREAENVDVVKAAGSPWVAGDWVYWNEAGSNFTNVYASDLYCVGKAQRAATNAAVLGYISLHDDFHPIQLGTTAAPKVLTAAQNVVDIHVSSAIVENVEAFNMQMTMSGVGATGGRAKFTMNTEAALGGWANALKAEIQFGTTGSVSGLASAFCAELVAPTTAPGGGNYVALEAEIVMPTGAGVASGMAYLYCNVQGAALATFQGDGYFAIIDNAGDGATDLFYDTANGTTDAWLRIRVNGTAYYIMLSLVATEA